MAIVQPSGKVVAPSGKPVAAPAKRYAYDPGTDTFKWPYAVGVNPILAAAGGIFIFFVGLYGTFIFLLSIVSFMTDGADAELSPFLWGAGMLAACVVVARWMVKTRRRFIVFERSGITVKGDTYLYEHIASVDCDSDVTGSYVYFIYGDRPISLITGLHHNEVRGAQAQVFEIFHHFGQQPTGGDAGIGVGN
jgi:hypothetical protein